MFSIIYIKEEIILYYNIYKSKKLNLGFSYCNIKELFPAIRSNLFAANPATKRISASIGAMGAVFGRNPEEEEMRPQQNRV